MKKSERKPDGQFSFFIVICMGHIFSQLALIGEQFSFLGNKIRLGLLLKCFILSSVGIVFTKLLETYI